MANNKIGKQKPAAKKTANVSAPKGASSLNAMTNQLQQMRDRAIAMHRASKAAGDSSSAATRAPAKPGAKG